LLGLGEGDLDDDEDPVDDDEAARGRFGEAD